MKTIVAAALLLAIVSGAYSYQDSYEGDIISSDQLWWFTMSYEIEPKFNYGTVYSGGQDTRNWQSYAMRFWAEFELDLIFELWDFYTWTYSFQFTAFDVQPTGVTWSSPANYYSSGNTCWQQWWFLNVVDAAVVWKSNMKECVGSLVELMDAGMWVMPECEYNDDSEAEWDNGLAVYNLSDMWTWANVINYYVNQCY